MARKTTTCGPLASWGFRIGSLAAVGLLAFSGTALASTRSTTITLPGSPPLLPMSATAKCPKHKRATGGGFLTAPFTADPAVFVFESRKVGQRSWRVSAAENGSSAVPITVFVYCSKGAPKTTEKSATIAVPAGPGIFSADASCGSSGKARAGGFLTPLSPPFANSGNMVDSFRLGAKTWRSRFYPQIGTPTLTSYAYCAKEKKPKARIGTAFSPLGPVSSNVTALSAGCTRGTAPVAGGFSAPDTTQAGIGFSLPYESLRAGKSWRVSEHHNDPASHALQAIAYCA
jgi:hypothetical protein